MVSSASRSEKSRPNSPRAAEALGSRAEPRRRGRSDWPHRHTHARPHREHGEPHLVVPVGAPARASGGWSGVDTGTQRNSGRRVGAEPRMRPIAPVRAAVCRRSSVPSSRRTTSIWTSSDRFGWPRGRPGASASSATLRPVPHPQPARATLGLVTAYVTAAQLATTAAVPAALTAAEQQLRALRRGQPGTRPGKPQTDGAAHRTRRALDALRVEGDERAPLHRPRARRGGRKLAGPRHTTGRPDAAAR